MAFKAKLYTRDFLAAMAAYAVVLVATRWAAGAFAVEGGALVALAILPMAPALFATFVFFRHFATMDEMFRRLHVESFAAGALFVCLGSFALGFLEDVAAPRVSLIWVLPATVAAWGVISCVRQLRIR